MSRSYINPKNYVQKGYHGTTADIAEGDSIRPADELAGVKGTNMSDTSKTYFAPKEEFANTFVGNQVNQAAEEGVTLPRERTLETQMPEYDPNDPSTHQEYDVNYLRKTLRTGLDLANMNRSSTPVRSAIQYARENAPRTVGRQSVLGTQWAPAPTAVQTSQPALTGLNWHEHGLPNYKVDSKYGGYDSLGKVHSTELAGYQEDVPSESKSEWDSSSRTKHVPGQMSLEQEGMNIPNQHDDLLGFG